MMRSPLAVIGMVVAAVLALVGLDAMIEAPSARQLPGAASATQTRAGAAYCTAGAGGVTGDLLAMAAPLRAAGTDFRLETFAGGAVTLTDDTSLTQPVFTDIADATAEGIGLSGRWWQAPALLGRAWQVSTPGSPSGTVVGPCPVEPASTWFIPGMSTAGGARSFITIGNPFSTDASLAISLMTPDGIEQPALTANVVVASRQVLTVEINTHAPRRADLGAIVRTRAGRVVVEGYTTFDAAIGGVEGVSLLSATPDLSDVWYVPYFADDAESGAEAWLWLSNPTDRAAAVTLTVHDSGGGQVPEQLEDITVEPGSVKRVDLRGLTTDTSTAAGLTVLSDNGVPIAASVTTVFIDESDSARSSVATVIGAPVGAESWVLFGGATAGREQAIALLNPTAEAATVEVEVLIEGQAVAVDTRTVRVPAGAMIVVDLGSLEPAAGHLIRVATTEGSIVPLAFGASPDGARGFTYTPGSAWSVFDRITSAPPVIFVPELANRFGTDLGPSLEGELPTEVSDLLQDNEAPIDSSDLPSIDQDGESSPEGG